MAPSEENLVSALDAQRGFWKFVGITAIITLVIYVFIIIIAAVTAGASAMHR